MGRYLDLLQSIETGTVGSNPTAPAVWGVAKRQRTGKGLIQSSRPLYGIPLAICEAFMKIREQLIGFTSCADKPEVVGSNPTLPSGMIAQSGRAPEFYNPIISFVYFAANAVPRWDDPPRGFF